MDFVLVIGGFAFLALILWALSRYPERGRRPDGGGEAAVSGDSGGDCDGGGGGGCD